MNEPQRLKDIGRILYGLGEADAVLRELEDTIGDADHLRRIDDALQATDLARLAAENLEREIAEDMLP